jgi:hypothetical protein
VKNPLPKKVRHDIAWDYWLVIFMAVWGLLWDGLLDGSDPEIRPVTYFVALALIIHAHGRRIRDTILALHSPEGAK